MAHHRLVLIVLAILTTGCDFQDERLARVTEQSLAQQMRQNAEIAQQSQQVVQHSGELTKAAQELVEQDALARRELLAAQTHLQSEFHAERRTLDARQQVLQTEQQALANARVREPIIAQAVFACGLVLATLLPLLIAAYALSRLPDHAASEERLLVDTLLTELTDSLTSGHSPLQTPLLPEVPPPRLDGPAATPPGAGGPAGSC